MNQRQLISQQAAALIANGLDDYHQAKMKAAKQLGISDKQNLPDNLEIEAALREHHQLFASLTQPAALLLLREVALRAMHWLADFDPWLSGSVLSGTANEYSAISLELIGVDVKQFELFLLNDDVVFDIRERSYAPPRKRSFKPSQSLALAQNLGKGGYTYEVTFDDAPVEITLFDSHQARLAKYPRDSIYHARAQLAEASAKFNLA